MIIDCHGHYTTAPKELHVWREAQIAALKDPGQRADQGHHQHYPTTRSATTLET